VSLIVAILLLLVVARIAAEAIERVKQPGMIGEITAGLILGPTLLNLIQPSVALTAIADLGVFLLMLLAGMEIELPRLFREFRGRNLWISIVGFALPFALGILAGILLGFDGMRAIFVGVCIAITALPVSIRILMDLGRLQSDVGQRIVGAAIANDVLALLVLGVILDAQSATADWISVVESASVSALKVLGFMIAVAVAARWTGRLTSRPASRGLVDAIVEPLRIKEPLFAVTLLFVLGFAALADMLGLHFIVGAFFGSVLLSHELMGPRNFEEVRRTASGITMGFLAPLFFASIGLEFNLYALNDATLIAVVLAAAFAGKLLAGWIGGRLAGLSDAESRALGIGLNGRGIMELVVAKIALNQGFIGTRLFSVLVLMGIVTTLVTPILLKRAFARIDAQHHDGAPHR
jgi:Kef-type K+ transport system membrane component KefB